MFQWFQGKKAYLVAAGSLIVGVLAAFGVVIPAVVWPILGALGLGAVRAGIQKSENAANGIKK